MTDDRESSRTDEEEPFEQPHPGSTGHERERESDLPVEPEVDDADDGPPSEQSEQTDQESKHSYPTSDPPANY